jgi:hypothetical protein
MWLRRGLAALPDLLLAGAYGAAVVRPDLLGDAAVLNLWRAALLEFFAIHASGFLKVTWVTDWGASRRARYVAGLVLAYTLVLGIIALVAGAWWPVPTFWVLTGNRALDAALREAPAEHAMEAEGYAWAGNVVLFAAGAALAGMAGAGRTAVLVVAGLYFAANALSELTAWGWVRRWMRRTRR